MSMNFINQKFTPDIRSGQANRMPDALIDGQSHQGLKKFMRNRKVTNYFKINTGYMRKTDW